MEQYKKENLSLQVNDGFDSMIQNFFLERRKKDSFSSEKIEETTSEKCGTSYSDEKYIFEKESSSKSSDLFIEESQGKTKSNSLFKTNKSLNKDENSSDDKLLQKKRANREAVRKFRLKQKEEHEKLYYENYYMKKKLKELINEDDYSSMSSTNEKPSLNSKDHKKLLVNLIKSISNKEFLSFIGDINYDKIIQQNYLTNLLKEKIVKVNFVGNSKNLFLLQKIINLVNSVEEIANFSI